MRNGCPICAGVGRVLAFGICREPVTVTCPECAGLVITPASAEDRPRPMTALEILDLVMRRPALPEATC